MRAMMKIKMMMRLTLNLRKVERKARTLMAMMMRTRNLLRVARKAARVELLLVPVVNSRIASSNDELSKIYYLLFMTN